jgi:IPT/TIG domain
MKIQNMVLLFSIFFIVVIGCNPDDDKPVNNSNNINNTNIEKVQVISITPARGPLLGGTEVMIYGKNFSDSCTVLFGETSASNITFISSFSLKVTTPPQTVTGAVDVIVSSGTEDSSLLNGFTYEENNTLISINWCNLHQPSTIYLSVQETSPPVYGHVFAEGVTDSPGRGLRITAQVGYGPGSANPESSEWVWVDAIYNIDTGDGNNDEYSAFITPSATGNFDVAYRFNGGGQWIYCDLNGSDDGYTSSEAAKLTVTEQTEAMPEWCILHYPAVINGNINSDLANVYGRVFMESVTDTEGEGAGITAQIGYGPENSNPGDAGWQWIDADYNVDSNLNDEYIGNLNISNPGNYDYAFRFSYESSSWIYCDLNGSDDGYSSSFAGEVSVDGTSEAVIDWCSIQWPENTASENGVDTALFYGRVFVDGITNGAGEGQGVISELGYALPGTNPVTNPEGWNWISANYAYDVDGLVEGDKNNDEYIASLNITQDGSYIVAFRFSADNGTTWSYCDLDGSDNGFDESSTSQLQVYSTPPQEVDWCSYHYPHDTTFAVDATSELIFGRVFVAGVTEGSGEGANITGQLGYSDTGLDPQTNPGDWTWVDASYNTSVDGLIQDDLSNDEYMCTLNISVALNYKLAYRFSRDSGTTWSYCDKDGLGNGFDTSLLADATVY